MVDPKATRFKAMSWEEKTMALEQSAQELLRAREERIASEPVEAVEAPQEAIQTTEISQVTLAQNKNFPEVQNAGERDAYVSTCPADDGSDAGYPRPHQVAKASD
jgi:hypothetical protein